MSSDSSLSEQALNKVAEVAITSQLNEAKQVDVKTQTDPIKLVQGKLDSVAISGEGMLMKQDLRIEALGVNISSVSIDPIKAVLGELELTESANAQVQILLTEADINRALDSDYLKSKMKNLKVEVQDKPVMIDVQKAHLQLLDSGEIALDIDMLMQEDREVKHCSAVVKPSLKQDGHRIEFEILSAEGKGLSLNFVTALFNPLVELLDLRNFDFDGIFVKFKDLKVREQKLLLWGNALVEKLPT